MGAITRKEFLQAVIKSVERTTKIWSGFFMDQASDKQAKTKVAAIDWDKCLAWGGVDCQFCYLACPLQETALRIFDQKPVIMASVCDGCGACGEACKTVTDSSAIYMKNA